MQRLPEQTGRTPALCALFAVQALLLHQRYPPEREQLTDGVAQRIRLRRTGNCVCDFPRGRCTCVVFAGAGADGEG